MSNPVPHQENPIMSSCWYTAANTFAVQEWEKGVRVKELSVNIRSGNDLWWNGVLEECGVGALSGPQFLLAQQITYNSNS